MKLFPLLGAAIFALILIFFVAPTTSHALPLQPAQQPSNYIPVTTFASGDSFFIRQDSFQPVAGERLQYEVIGVPRQQVGIDTAQPVTTNEVNCRTGEYLSSISKETLGDDGSVLIRETGSPFPIKLSSRSQLYAILKKACQDNLPNLELQW